MKTFVRTGLTLLALAACGQEGSFANEFEPNIQQEQRLDEVDHYLTKELGDGIDQVTSVNPFRMFSQPTGHTKHLKILSIHTDVLLAFLIQVSGAVRRLADMKQQPY